MKHFLFVSFILLSLSLNLLAQSQDMEKVPRKLLNQLVTMKKDSLPFLNTSEGECLNSVFSDFREAFDFTGKKVGFILRGEKQNKANYFNMYKGYVIDKKSPLDIGTLYVFNKVQKERSGGYDAAIIYWDKYLMPVGYAIDQLRDRKKMSPELSERFWGYLKIPKELLSRLVKMETDSLPFLNAFEGEYLDSVFRDRRKDFDFTGKKIDFIKDGSKADYFNGHKKYFFEKANSSVGSLYILNETQKEELGGYDALILYKDWCKFFKPIKAVVRELIFSTYKPWTPENILAHNFNISLKGFDYTINSFKEHWKFSGDGYLRFVIKFKTLTQKEIAYFKKQCNGQSLPVSKALYREVTPKDLSKRVLRSKNGYYLYDYDTKRTIKLKIFIFDEKKKEAVFYMQTN